ncbi:MAG: FliM/FliN family flagellar motor switch protein [Candidatus Caenarcaniphilales bacterium]|nr:FliM/FliN family flagellar motor switch protein [Candidatus Caenarcaniphilales bacterium]
MSYLGLKDVLGLRASQDLDEKSLRLHNLGLHPVKICEDFFQTKLTARLSGIADKLHQASWKGISTLYQIGFGEYRLRIDRELVLHFLAETFGARENDAHFHCQDMTDLEVRVIEACVQKIIDHATETLSERFLENHPEESQVYLIWLVSSGGKIGKIALSVPQSLLIEQAPLFDTNPEFAQEVNLRCDLWVGSTTLTLLNMIKLEEGDFLLLENSSSKYLELKGIKQKGQKIQVSQGAPRKNAKWHKIKLSDYSADDQEESLMDMEAKTDILHDFPVELRAEFREVSLTFKELVQLQEGSVLPLDKVTESELLLMSKDKPVARGELVVVGDKFGILIKEMLLGAD